MSIRTPLVIIQVDGVDLTPDEIRKVLRVSIKLHEKKASTGELVFRDPDFHVLDSRRFSKGTEFFLIMGWTNEIEPMGPYVVKSYKPTFPGDGESKIVIKFQDKSHKMNRRQRRRRFSNTTPAQILQQIAEEHGLEYAIESVEGVRFTDDFPLIQANKTDARLIQMLARRYGYIWGVDNGVLYFRRPVDLDATGQQSEVKVLSYRINDWSLLSFDPEIKFTSGRRRRGARQTASNVDLLGGTSANNGIFSVSQIRETISSVSPRLGEVVETLTGQDTDDDEPTMVGVGVGGTVQTSDVQTERTNQGRGRRQERLRLVDRRRQILGRYIVEPSSEAEENENEESEPGDESGAATPDNEQEANRRSAANVTRAAEIVEGSATPTIASMKYRAGDAVILAGVGDRLSGRYRIVEVDQVIAGGTFQTKLRVKRQTFRPSATSQEQIAEATEQAGSGSDGTSSTGTPPREISARKIDRLNQRVGGLVFLVDGQSQE
jgi:phage protein D